MSLKIDADHPYSFTSGSTHSGAAPASLLRGHMGYYTQLKVRLAVKGDSPIKDFLAAVTNPETDLDAIEKPDHPFFKDERWDWVLSHHGTMGYWKGAEGATFDGKTLVINCQLKNYDSAIEKFFDWITPHLQPDQGKVGTKYGEDDHDRYDVYFADRFLRPFPSLSPDQEQ